MKYILFVLPFVANLFNAQVISNTENNKASDTLVVVSGEQDSLEIYKPTVDDYKIRTQFSDYKIFNTDLTVDKSYAFTQFNNRDNFGKIQFANIGSGFQDLIFNVNTNQNLSVLPTNKSHFIIGSDDVRYYDVKTPTTSFVYHNGIRNGAALQSTYTQNIGKTFNFAIEYMGLRSQGSYRNSLAATNNFIFSAHYKSRNNKYEAFAHYLHQNVNNQENGGVADMDIFFSGDSRFNNRANIETNLEGVNTRLYYRRYYFSHEFAPFDVARFPFKIRHTLSHQGNKYFLNQDTAQPYFGTDVIDGFGLNSKKWSNNFSNTVSLLWDNEKFKLDAGVRHQSLSLNNLNRLDLLATPDQLKENRIGAVANLQMKLWDKVQLKSLFEYSNGSTFGNFIQSNNQFSFEPIKDYFVDAHFNFQSAVPSFNNLINTSYYAPYNYYLANPNNQVITEVGGKVKLKWFDSQLFVNYFKIDNYAYFNSAGQSLQSNEALNISQIGGEATFKFGKFNLNTRLHFQNAMSQKELFPMPSFVGRANIYYQAKAFKDAAEVQTGVKMYYFSKFASRDYAPLLNEFIMPGANAHQIGGQPIADVYFNLKVKRMFFFVEAQHINTTFLQNKSFTAPNFPIYDFRLNLGLVWYIFS